MRRASFFQKYEKKKFSYLSVFICRYLDKNSLKGISGKTFWNLQNLIFLWVNRLLLYLDDLL